MGSLQCEVRVLEGGRPLLFSWENPRKQIVESILVTCPCQKLDLEHRTFVRNYDDLHTAEEEAWASRLRKSLEKADVVSFAASDSCKSVLDIVGVCDSPRVRKRSKKTEAQKVDIASTECNDETLTSIQRNRSKSASTGGKVLGKTRHKSPDRRGTAATEQKTAEEDSSEQSKSVVHIALKGLPDNSISENSISEKLTDTTEPSTSDSTHSENINESRESIPSPSHVSVDAEEPSGVVGEEVTSLSSPADPNQTLHLTCENDNQMEDISIEEYHVEESPAVVTPLMGGELVATNSSQDVPASLNMLSLDQYTELVTTDDEAGTDIFVTEMQGVVANLVSLEESVNLLSKSKEILEVPNRHSPGFVETVDTAIRGGAQNRATSGNVEVMSRRFVQADSTNPLPEENALMNAIDSMIETIKSGAVTDNQQTEPQTVVGQEDPHNPTVPSTKVEFIRKLTEEERKKMFHFRTDIDERNRKMLESGEGAYLCEHCGKVLSLKAIRGHMKTHEKNRTRDYICDVCAKAFTTNFGLKNHLRTHDPNHSYKCRYCPKEFKSKYGQTGHERLHFRVFSEICKVCGDKFTERPKLKLHMEKAHGVSSNALDGTPEGVKVARKMDHQKVPKGATKVTCEICGKEVSAVSFRQHVDIHKGRTFTCPICGKVMKYLTRFTHLKLHNTTKEFKCSYCDKAFVNKQGLVHHTRVHTGEKPLQCRHCDRRFSRYSSREVHENAHTGHRPYACTICEKAWKDRSSYRTHMRKFHPDEPLFYKRETVAINYKRGADWAVFDESK